MAPAAQRRPQSNVGNDVAVGADRGEDDMAWRNQWGLRSSLNRLKAKGKILAVSTPLRPIVKLTE